MFLQRVSISGEPFPLARAPERTCVRAASVFSTKKNIVKERTTIGRETYVQKGGWAENERQREERDRVVCPYPSDIREGGPATWGGNDQKRRAIRRLLSFSSHCSPLSLLFTFPVPRSPFSELHAPNPTSDPHKGRRGRNTFGKSSSTPLQRIRRVSQKSLIPRYVCFTDSLGSGGAQAEWETDSSSVWSIARDVWCESCDHPRISSDEKVKITGILQVYSAFYRIRLNVGHVYNWFIKLLIIIKLLNWKWNL